MKHPKVRTSRIVNLFGILGYLSVMLQWLWLTVLLLPSVLENQTVKDIFLPQEAPKQVVETAYQTPSFVLVALAVIITIVILVVTAIVLARLPATIARVGKKTTDRAAQSIVPAITHHKKLPAKKQRTLSIRVVKYLKFSIVLLPVLLLALGGAIPLSLPNDIALFIGCSLAIGSLLWFSLEYTLAHIKRIDFTSIY